jgi:hypothetical protein
LATRTSDLADLTVKYLYFILPVVATLAPTTGVAGQGFVVFLLDASATAYGFETVTPCVIRRFSGVVHPEVHPDPAAESFAA